jgi:lipid A disaccharide synthetase
MSLLSRKKTIAGIVAPINKIIDELNALAEEDEAVILAKTEEADRIAEEIASAEKEKVVATELADKYAKLVA